MASSGPLLIVLSGPSGVGKDSVLARMRAQGYPFHYTVTATSRPAREGEVDGKDYYFVTREWFHEALQSSRLLEHACVYGHLYGVPKAPIIAALAGGQDVIMRTNVEGARSIRALAPGAVLIFLLPPSLERLAERLRGRRSDSVESIERRLATVREEMESLPSFDYAVPNEDDQLDRCVASIAAIIQAEKLRVQRPPLGLS